MYRFQVTHEFSTLSVDDWLDNSKWFDIKFLVDSDSNDTRKEMGSDSYGRHISQVLQRLGLPTNKLLHLGRNIGARILNLLEEQDEAIRKDGSMEPFSIRQQLQLEASDGADEETRRIPQQQQTLL